MHLIECRGFRIVSTLGTEGSDLCKGFCNWSEPELSAKIAVKEAEMPEFSVQYLILLVGLCLLLLLLVISFLLKRDLRSCGLFLLGTGLIIIVGYVLDFGRLYQCAFTTPDQVRVGGHVNEYPNSPANNYLVILYREDEEAARFVTGNGRFAADRKDEQRDGLFELTVANESQLTRCSMLKDFKQDSNGLDFLWLGNKTIYLWHNFGDIEAGTYQFLNKEEPQKKRYTLVVLPNNVDLFPQEIKDYSTYLDQNREVAINIPIMTYTLVGNQPAEYKTEYYIHAGRLSNSPPGSSPPGERKVRDAWVEDGGTYETTSINLVDPPIIDRDNCMGSLPQIDSVPVSLIYIHEVQFQGNTNFGFDLGLAALKAAPSLGFTQGQMDTIVAQVSVDTPAGTHKKYKVFWQEVWRKGSLAVDFGQQINRVPFRARVGMDWSVQTLHVDCP